MIYPRRAMLKFVGGILAFIHGTPISQSPYSQMARQAPPAGLRLVLDGMEDVVVLYRGEMIRLTPAEIMASLRQPQMKDPTP